MMCGGTGDVRDADADVQTLVDSVRDFSQEKANRTFEQFTAVQYKTQVVAGTNYFVKVQVSNDEYAHLRIFKALPHVNALPALSAQQLGKTKDDELEYFE